MKLITDTSANLPPERTTELGVDVVPLNLTFMGKSYQDGINISPADLYSLFSQNPGEYPITSQPSVGDFLSIYEKYGGEEILSVHLSSGLSGTYSAAVTAARQVLRGNVTVIDSKMLGPVLGWMVEIGAHGIKTGWPKEKIIAAIKQVRNSALTMATFSDLSYLIHGGRIGHFKGLIASALKIKPILTINDLDGRFKMLGRGISMKILIQKMAQIGRSRFGDQPLRLQIMHGNNLPGVDALRAEMTGMLNCVEDKLVSVTTTLGAHAGPTVVGYAAIPRKTFDSLL